MRNLRWTALLIVAAGVAAIAAIYLFSTRPASNRPVVAIATLMTHPALDALEKGIRDELAARGYIDGKTIQIVHRNANGQIQLTATIANDLESLRPAVIVPITTPMAQAVVKVAKGKVVFASVTDPLSAGVVTTLAGTPRITGASDAWPYAEQLKLIREITPSVRRLGVLYNPGEAASQHGIKQIRALAASLGFTLVEAPVNSTADMDGAARSIADRVDALYLSSDNTVISGMSGALKVAFEKKLPYYVGDSGSVEKGGLAAVSVGYYEHGRHVGALIAQVLEGKDRLPIVVEVGKEISINQAAARRMGVDIPKSVVDRATNVYTEIK